MTNAVLQCACFNFRGQASNLATSLEGRKTALGETYPSLAEPAPHKTDDDNEDRHGPRRSSHSFCSCTDYRSGRASLRVAVGDRRRYRKLSQAESKGPPFPMPLMRLPTSRFGVDLPGSHLFIADLDEETLDLSASFRALRSSVVSGKALAE